MGRYDSKKGPSSLTRANGKPDEPATVAPLRYGNGPDLSHRSEDVMLTASCGDTVAMRVRGRSWASWAIAHWQAVADRDGFTVARERDVWTLTDADGDEFVRVELWD